LVLEGNLTQPRDLTRWFAPVRGHPMARASLEMAVWDLWALQEERRLADVLHEDAWRAAADGGGGRAADVRDRVPVGISLGIESSPSALVDEVARRVSEGYGRVKLKIKPGWDVDIVRAVRERWPDLPLQVDANAAYTPAETATLRELDDLDLLLIEQPFHHDDLVDHARLQASLETPLCLDESIKSPDHARWALEIDACRVINIKVGRVGGLSAAVDIHNLCEKRNVPVWCGGMLETNVGRAANVAVASLPNFVLPGDISASSRYYERDVAGPNFELQEGSTVCVPPGPGLGVRVDRKRLEGVRERHLVLGTD
jgi:O-succinylbenzoate synthase